jgi:hypothetical protein
MSHTILRTKTLTRLRSISINWRALRRNEQGGSLKISEHKFVSAPGSNTDPPNKPTLEPQAMDALLHGPRGALYIASVAVALLFVGWLLFYFLLFMRRGEVG